MNGNLIVITGAGTNIDPLITEGAGVGGDSGTVGRISWSFRWAITPSRLSKRFRGVREGLMGEGGGMEVFGTIGRVGGKGC
jgi:hypothetical protein